MLAFLPCFIAKARANICRIEELFVTPCAKLFQSCWQYFWLILQHKKSCCSMHLSYRRSKSKYLIMMVSCLQKIDTVDNNTSKSDLESFILFPRQSGGMQSPTRVKQHIRIHKGANLELVIIKTRLSRARTHARVDIQVPLFHSSLSEFIRIYHSRSYPVLSPWSQPVRME